MLMSGDWREQLRLARISLGLSQAEASKRAHVSESALKSWESQNVRVQRKPAREAIKSVLDALQVDRDVYIEVMENLGYGSSLDDFGPRFEFHLQEAAELANDRRWPAIVVNDVFEVLHANAAFLAAMSQGELPGGDEPLDRSLLGIFSRPNFYGRLEEWPKFARTYVEAVAARSVYEHRPLLSDLRGYFERVASWLDAHASERASQFREIARSAESRPVKVRWHLPLAWEHQSAMMRFDVMVSPASTVRGLMFMDFVPLDAQTWNAIEQQVRAAASEPRSERSG